MNHLQKDYDNEKIERLQHEKEIYRTISDEVFTMNEKLDREKSDRNTKISIFKEETIMNFKTRDKLFGDFQSNIRSAPEKSESGTGRLPG